MSKKENSFDISRFLDSNVRYLQYIPYTIGCVGLYIISKRLRVTEKFTNVTQVPDNFVKRRIKLRGQIVNVDENCHIKIDHIPIFTNRWMKSHKQPNNLVVKLFGVDIDKNEEQKPLIQEHLNTVADQEIWFQPWRKVTDYETPVLYCVITKARLPFDWNLNADVLRSGLARRAFEPELGRAVDLPSRMLRHKLYRAEAYAKRKRVGVWERPSSFELLRKKIENVEKTAMKTGSGIIDKGKKLIDTFKYFIKRLF